jgi:hypothetical protein
MGRTEAVRRGDRGAELWAPCGTMLQARGKTESEVAEMLDQGVFNMRAFKKGGWVTGLKYADQVRDIIKARSGGKPDKVTLVALRRYKYGVLSPEPWMELTVRPLIFVATGGGLYRYLHLYLQVV